MLKQLIFYTDSYIVLTPFSTLSKSKFLSLGKGKDDETDTGLVCPDGVALSHVWLRDAGGDYSGAALGLE
jgi:hypothetical protein